MTEQQYDFVDNAFVANRKGAEPMNDHHRIHVLERKVEMLLQALATQTDIHSKNLNDLANIMGPGVSSELKKGRDQLISFNNTLAAELERIDG